MPLIYSKSNIFAIKAETQYYHVIIPMAEAGNITSNVSDTYEYETVRHFEISLLISKWRPIINVTSDR